MRTGGQTVRVTTISMMESVASEVRPEGRVAPWSGLAQTVEAPGARAPRGDAQQAADDDDIFEEHKLLNKLLSFRRGEIEDSEREGLLRGLVAALARGYANLEQGHRLRRAVG